MLRSLLSGLVLAMCVAAALLIGGGSELEHVALLGAGLGAVVGLVPSDSPLGGLGGFTVGFIAAWIAFGIRVLLLPDTTAGRAVAAFLVILICGAVAAFSGGKVPLWSALIGAVAIVGAYETSFTSSPSQFLSASPQAASTVLLAAGFGFIGASVVTTFSKGPDAEGAISTPAPYSVSAGLGAMSVPDPFDVSAGSEAMSAPDLFSISAGLETTRVPDPSTVSTGPEATSTPDPYNVPQGPQDTSPPDPFILPALPKEASPPDLQPSPTGIQDTVRAS